MFLLRDLGFDSFERLEIQFHKKNLRSAFNFTVSVGKMMPVSNKEEAYLKGEKKLAAEGALLVQRQIFLAEERERISCEHQDGATDEVKSCEMVDELETISTKLQENWGKFKELLGYEHNGVWFREDRRKGPKDYLRNERATCKERNDCCARDCQCCDKTRIWRDFQTDRPPIYLYSHCTKECGCCVRLEQVFSCEPKKMLQSSEVDPDTHAQGGKDKQEDEPCVI